MGTPEEVIDWQREEPLNYNRIMIYPDDLKFVTKEVLEELMRETDISVHGEILHKAEEDYYKIQSRFEVSPEEELVTESGKKVIDLTSEMRAKVKRIIDEIPDIYLPDLAKKLQEFWVEKKAKVEKPVPVKKWKEREREEPVTITEEGVRVAVIEMATDKDADFAEQAFFALQEDRKVYKSAVVLNGTLVRTVEFEKSTKGTTVVMFNAASNESALGMRMLFDGTLRKEAIIVRVTRAERKLSVSYTTTGIKVLPKKPKRLKTGSVFEQNDTLEFLKKRRGE
jgi:hypothetical protein